ncbi:hypothetical protein M422DRAFT_24152 [Sphaerobolus stellatus SS14]|nr:hypothetical protein M422DRAFT_24152 [Sphaerobolus stellatus SS14]
MDNHVLSIQSHVAWGYVGGRAAVFPLQLLGYDVEVVNTVNYSNHSGYGRTGGMKTNPQELVSIFEIMEKNGLLNPSRVLTGYVPGAEALTVISGVIQRLREQNPNIIYLLDPVMGDAGRLYVSEDVIPIYRDMLSLATIITPNYFEAELLTGIPIDSVKSLQDTLRIFHNDYKIPHVVISSIPLNGPFLKSLPQWLRFDTLEVKNAEIEDTMLEPLLCIASSADRRGPDDNPSIYAFRIPRIPGYFSGVGDLFSALVLGHFKRPQIQDSPSGTPLSNAVYKGCRTTHAILWETHLYSMSLPPEERTESDVELDTTEPDRKVRRMRGRELRLIQEQRLIIGDSADSGKYKVEEGKGWADFWNI